MKDCEECKRKQHRIGQLEGLLERMGRYLDDKERRRMSTLDRPEFKTYWENGRPFSVVAGGKNT